MAVRLSPKAGIKADQAAADQPDGLPGLLLGWYDQHRRVLPWRFAPGEVADPYRVWLSEIMLQQTTVATVGPYFQNFLGRWPTVKDLAAADLDDVLRAWAGLGYYARARNLHKCAIVVASQHGGRFPDTEEGLLSLPGIGAYTAAAILAIAFDKPATAMDGNVERVMSRLRAVTDPLPASKPILRAHAAALVPARRPGDYTQALFDLGATICAPRKPRCILCPWTAACEARKQGIAEDLPAKTAKAPKPTRRALAFVLSDVRGLVALRRRPEKGLLGGMMEVPTTPWEAGPVPSLATARSHAPLPGVDWTLLPGSVRHTFTHFEFEIRVVVGRAAGAGGGADLLWVAPDALEAQALPTVMIKILRHALYQRADG
ncbi:A/G-specific adenine glycosylase [Niveispirillum lacus]|uniref:Adenine DNA glycosylase n=1 Tax=Niveispirillum lacus TaxID=1981099 RepID=A0A255Z505_9PROT|nr:A/G-specific adenine glycosylase [Niveispirillum lacus]OYQ36512.1 A/G-specific adenine glycosylase [Niveispirillum lacus]